jgi:hypothetical protein
MNRKRTVWRVSPIIAAVAYGESSVTGEIDIWRSAKLLMHQHGADADLYASARIDTMIASGDPNGETVWRRVLAAIKELQRERPKSAHVH